MTDPKDEKELTHADLEIVPEDKPAGPGTVFTESKDISINKAQTHDAAWHRMDNYIRG